MLKAVCFLLTRRAHMDVILQCIGFELKAAPGDLTWDTVP